MKNLTRRKFIHKVGMGAVLASSANLVAAESKTREAARGSQTQSESNLRFGVNNPMAGVDSLPAGAPTQPMGAELMFQGGNTLHQHTQVITSGSSTYAIRMGGRIDGENTRDPVGYWAFNQYWEPNVTVRLENIGDVPVVNPWLRRADQADTRTLQSIVGSVVKPGMSDREKARRIWEFDIRNRFHATTNDDECGDAIKRFNCYGYSLCYDESKIISDLWRAEGLKVRKGYPQGHSTAEVFYDNAWHLLDPDEDIICLLRDNETISSEPQVVADHDLMKRTHNYGPLSADDRFRDEGGASLYSYTGKRTGEQPSLTKHKMDFTLRPGEALTWEWKSTGNRFHQKPFSCCGVGTEGWVNRWRLIARVKNGELRYAPNFGNPSNLKFVETDGVEFRQSGLFGAGLYLTGRSGSITIPVKIAWPVVGGRLDIDFRVGNLQREFVKASVSFDQGKTWQEADASHGSDFARMYVDLNPMFPSGGDARYAYLLRLELASNAKTPQVCVSDMCLRSTLQMAQLAMPGIHLGGNTFLYSGSSGPGSKVRISHVWRECDSAEVPGAPEAAAYPPDGGIADGTRIHFRWEPPATGPRPVDYEFILSEYPDMRWELSPDFRKLVSLTANRNTASYQLPYIGLLNPGQKYYWHVRARSAEGVWGPWSKVFSFSAKAPAVPVDVTAHFDPASRTVILKWERGKGGTAPVRYLVFGSAEQGFTASATPYLYDAGIDGIKHAAPNLLLQTKGTVTSLKIPAHLWNPFYRVVAVDGAGQQSGPSAMGELPHPLVRTHRLPEAYAGSYYRAKIDVSASIGDLVYLDATGNASFRGGDEPAFAVTGAPQGLTIDNHSGLLAGSLPAKAAGRYKLTVSVSGKNSGAHDSLNLVLLVRPQHH